MEAEQFVPTLTARDFASFLDITPQRLLILTQTLKLDQPPHSFILGNKRFYTIEATRTLLKHRGFIHPRLWISILNLKGGVGKTTLALALAFYLSRIGGKVLLVDLDPQSNATNTCVENTQEIFTISDIVRLKLKSKQAVLKTKHGFDIIPSKLGDTSFEQFLIHEVSTSPIDHANIYKNLFADISAEYDYVIFDAPPSIGRPVYLAAACSDLVVIPVVADRWAMEGLELTMGSINKAKSLYKVDIKTKVIVNKFDARQTTAHDYLREIHKKPDVEILRTLIRVNTPFIKIQAGNFYDCIVNKKNFSSYDIQNFVHELIPIEIPKPRDNQ